MHRQVLTLAMIDTAASPCRWISLTEEKNGKIFSPLSSPSRLSTWLKNYLANNVKNFFKEHFSVSALKFISSSFYVQSPVSFFTSHTTFTIGCKAMQRTGSELKRSAHFTICKTLNQMNVLRKKLRAEKRTINLRTSNCFCQTQRIVIKQSLMWGNKTTFFIVKIQCICFPDAFFLVEFWKSFSV